MAHGMSSGKKMIGASATHAAAAEFIFRGYNVAFAEFDMGIADDMMVFSPESSRVFRVQVRAKQSELRFGADGVSTPIITPMELMESGSNLDFVVHALRFSRRWLIGLFDAASVQKVMDAGVGCYTSHAGRNTYDPRVTVDRGSGRILFSGVDVSEGFSHVPDSKWDELFPIRIEDAKRQHKLLKQPRAAISPISNLLDSSL
ncbi:MAG: hypothetical protein WCO57_11365 [Verrucomicrobiota bacterium]